MSAIRFLAIAAIFMLALVEDGLSQTGDFLVTGGIDVYKTDRISGVSKAQFGLDVNYYLTRTFTVSGGVEIWTDPSNNSSFAVGARWSPIDLLFLRFRGLLGENEFGVGAGYSHNLTRNWRLEGMADYFILESHLAFRIGVAYAITKF